jgi:predicted metal-dependent peptidase
MSEGEDLKRNQRTSGEKIEKFSQNSTNFSRSGNGGTFLYPAIEYCIKKNVNIENLVIITDGCIEDYWDNPPKSNVIFLLPGLNKLSLSTDNFPKKPRIFNV